MAKLMFLQKDSYVAGGHSVRPHKHSCWELVYYMNSTGRSRLYGKNDTDIGSMRIRYLSAQTVENTLSFQKNQLILYEPNLVHDEVIEPLPENQSQHEQRVVSFGFVPDASMAQYLSTDVYNDDSLVVYNLIKNLQAEYANHSSHYEIALDSIVSLILVQLARRKQNANCGGNLKYVLHFIDEYFTTHISVENLARMANYSLSQFRKVFMKETGLSPKQYVLRRRTEEAKYLLQNASLPFSEIALRCGYEDYNQFQVFFKKETGLSPSDFRAQAKQTPPN